MNVLRLRDGFGALAAAAILASCSNSSGNSVAPIRAATATPTAVPAAPTPTATPTAGTLAANPESFCTLSNDTLLGGQFPAVPGNYVFFIAEGLSNGSVISSVESGWEGVSIAANPSASPTAVATATPVASPTPINTSTPSETVDLYFGSYDIPAFAAPALSPSPAASPVSGPTTTPSPVAIAETKGCFILEHLVAPTPSPGASGAIDTAAIGVPFDFNAYDAGQTIVTEITPVGSFTSFNIASLTPSGGNGSFTLDAPVTGTFTVGPAQVFNEYDSAFKRRIAALRKHGLIIKRY